MPVFGLNNGMVPIVAYNYGAGRPDRIVQTIKLSVAAAVTIMLAGLLAFQLAPHILLDLFRSENDSGDLLTIGIPALRIISLSFLFAGYSIVCSSVFQALGPWSPQPAGVRGAPADGPAAGCLSALPGQRSGPPSGGPSPPQSCSL